MNHFRFRCPIVVLAVLVTIPVCSMAQPETAPSPYTAMQIRDSSAVGRTYRYRVESMGKAAIEKKLVWKTWSEQDCSIESSKYDLAGKAIGKPKVEKSSWQALRQHAVFLEKNTTTRNEKVTVPAGTFDTTVYQLVEEVDGNLLTKHFWFAPHLPGPPVKLVVTKRSAKEGGDPKGWDPNKPIFQMLLLSHKTTCVVPVLPFALDSTSISPSTMSILRSGLSCILARGGKVTVAGHIGEKMTASYALAAGQRLADVVTRTLVTLGVPKERLTTISYGRDRPRCRDDGPACYRQNQRVELVFDAP